MRKENLVRTKTVSVFDLSKLTVGNAYLYTHITDDGKVVRFQGILLQKYEDQVIFAISNRSDFINYQAFIADTVAGGSIVRLPAEFLGEDDTLEEMTIRNQSAWEKDGDFVACPCI